MHDTKFRRAVEVFGKLIADRNTVRIIHQCRGGKRKRFYTVTNGGKAALIKSRELRDQLWDRIPGLVLKKA